MLQSRCSIRFHGEITLLFVCIATGKGKINYVIAKSCDEAGRIRNQSATAANVLGEFRCGYGSCALFESQLRTANGEDHEHIPFQTGMI